MARGQWLPIACRGGASAPRCRRGGVGGSRCQWLPVPPVPGAAGAVSGAGPAEFACPVPPAPLAAAVTCRRGCRSSLPPSLPSILRPSLPPSLLPWPGWRWERPRSHHEHPQGLQHVGDRLPGDQIPTERGNPNPGRQEHQVRAGGHLPGQRSPGGDEGQGRQPQSHPTPDRQRGPVLRGLRALRGSCGAKHSAGVPQVGLSPASPPCRTLPAFLSALISHHPHLSALSWHLHLRPSPGKHPRPKLLIAAASASLLPTPALSQRDPKKAPLAAQL